MLNTRVATARTRWVSCAITPALEDPLSASAFAPARRLVAFALIGALGFIVAGCGGGNELEDTPRAAAQSLQEAMDASSRAIDNARSTRGSLDNLTAALQTAADQTGDAVVVLTPRADKEAEAALLVGAKAQRSFLQNAGRAASARSRGTALAALTQTRIAGRTAADGYAAAARKVPALAGTLPASTTFNSGRLRDATLKVNQKKSKKKPTPTPRPSGGGRSSGSACGAGISVNSVTSCPFARNVASAYSESGGGVIEVWSPATQQSYAMSCSGAMPVVCTGGSGARVEIR